jgi:hypothetical protein
MIPTKYPKRPAWTRRFQNADEFEERLAEDIHDYHNGHIYRAFYMGSGYAHARYLADMMFRHPVMYYLWYRWWIPSLLQEEERTILYNQIDVCRVNYRPYWIEFSLYHPVLFFLWVLAFQVFVKFPTFAIKKICRICNCHFFRLANESGIQAGQCTRTRAEIGIDKTSIENVLTHKNDDMPSE